MLDAAIQKRDELREDLRKIEDFILTYRRLRQELRIDVKSGVSRESSPEANSPDEMSQVDDRAAEAPDAAPARRVRVRDNPKPDAVVAAAVEVIREAGKPLSRRQIHEELTARGMEVKGADAIKALGTMLWRSGRDHLVQLEGRGYWDKSQGYPPAAYDPDPMFDMSKRGADDPGLGGPNY